MSLRHLLASVFVLGPAAVLVAQQSGKKADDFSQPRAERAQNEAKEDRTSDRRAADASDSRTARAASPATQHFILTCLIGENKNEVALARIAEQQGSSREVKEFAATMVREHTQMISQLEKLQGNFGRSDNEKATGRPAGDHVKNSNEPSPMRTGDDADRSNVREATSAAGTAVAMGAMQELVSIKTEIGERCLASARKELSQKEGTEFDKCFMMAQAMGHQHMLDSLMVFKNHTSGDLQQLIAKGADTTEKHLDHAKEIAKTLEKSASGSTARRNTETDKE